MRVRIDDVFVLKFALELERMEANIAGHEAYGTHSVPMRMAIEEFLEAMAPALARVLKHHLLDTLLADAAARFPQAARENSSGTPISIDSVTAI
jgi:hypothetical protein